MATLPNHNPPPFGAATTTPALNWVPAGPAMEKRRTELFSRVHGLRALPLASFLQKQVLLHSRG